jgi:hypothetical protein
VGKFIWNMGDLIMERLARKQIKKRSFIRDEEVV